MNSTTTSPVASDRDFLISRIIDAPRAQVFKAWTDPAVLALWFGPKTFTTSECELDVRPGGAHRVVMRGVDGVEYPLKGFYREVVVPERLIMTLDTSEHPAEWQDLVKPNREEGENNPVGEMLQTVSFDEEGGKTRLTIRTRFKSVAIRDSMLKIGMNEGWTESLERLNTFVTNTDKSSATAAPKSNQLLKGNTMLVQSYLFFDGRCEEAAEFYRTAVGAEITMLMRYKDSPDPQPPGMLPAGSENKVMHMAMRIGDTTVMASDGHCLGRPNFQGFAMSLTVPNDAEAEKRFNALADGGKVQMPLAKSFFSSSFGMVADRFGVMWMVIVMA